MQKVKDLPEETVVGTVKARIGDPLSLRSWRPNSPNANKLITPVQPVQPISLSANQPNKLPSPRGPIQQTEDSSEDDFTNDFLADLLPGRVIGGPPAQQAEVQPPELADKSLILRSST